MNYQLLLILYLDTFPIGRTDMKDISAVMQVVVRHMSYILRLSPFFVNAVHLVIIYYLAGTYKVHS